MARNGKRMRKPVQVESEPGIPAATLILFSRPDSRAAARHLMIQRSAKMRFAANALVFPGGRVDEDDHVVATDHELIAATPADPAELAHRVTAIRETLEEAGILVGARARLTGSDIAALQDGLKSGSPFSRLLRDAGVRLDLSALVLWAEWHPKLESNRRFDTRFYIARHDGDLATRSDADEACRALWLSAKDALHEAGAGTAKIVFPTLRNLERLAAYPTFEAAKAHVETVEVRPISTYIEEDEQGEKWACIPPDSGYPVTRQLLSELLAP